MGRVSVDIAQPTPYLERHGKLGRIKRNLTHRHYLNLVAKHVAPDARVLDVGTGSGSWLVNLHAKFPKLDLNGVEYDERLVAATNELLGQEACRQGNAEAFAFDDAFDLITSFQVIEHLYEPNLFLANCHKHLKTGGVLLITTPNLDCIARRVTKEKWHGFRDDHVSLKSAPDWTRYITESGFTPIYTGSTFFSGIPILNKAPLGVFNWALLLGIGSLPWNQGESYVGMFRKA